MRITNKIIQNNSLNNINTNKTLQDKLSTQLSSEKKISRPSEDPIVALRSLRLRTSVNQTAQYVEKNVEDAKSWLTVTEDAISTLSDIITDIRKQYVKGTSDSLTVSDRRIIAENLEALSEEIYNTGNADFAGRTVFTGYRTGESLTFPQQTDLKYVIYQNFTSEDFTDYTYVENVNPSATVVEQNIESGTVKRIRLPYGDLDASDISVTVNSDPSLTPDIITVDSADLTLADIPDGKVIFVKDTGDLFFSKSVADAVNAGGDVDVTYAKTKWAKNDLRPEHYFKCEAEGIEYNFDNSPAQEITYNIGVNQTLRINTTADECFNHDIRRDIEDVLRCISEVEGIEDKLKKLEKEYAAIPETDTATLKAKKDEIDAAKKEQTFLNGKLHDIFKNSITLSDSYLDQNNVALTNCGTRSKRLELIENRLDTQLETLKELKSENEDVDLAEAAIQLSSANYAYDAALMATGKILKESLLNYI